MEEAPRTKRPYTKPIGARVDLLSHEVALQVCKTPQRRTQPNGASIKCTQGGTSACMTIQSTS